MGLYLFNTNNNIVIGNSFTYNGVGVTHCNAIDDSLTSNTFIDSYLADMSLVKTGEMDLASTIYTCGPLHLQLSTNKWDYSQVKVKSHN